MSRWIVLILVIAIIGGGFWISRSQNSYKVTNTQNEEIESYTCPMHPEVKQTNPGQCPICHMDLVKVKSTKTPNIENHKLELINSKERSIIQANNDDLKLIGVQKYIVEIMSLNSKIPISGHFISSSQIAFQIYERELGEIRIGNEFTGEAASNPEIELDGKITIIDSYVDPISRTIRVVGTLNSRLPNTRVESSFHGQVLREIPNVIAIPEDAVLHTGKDNLVYLFQEGDLLKAHSVKLGVKVKGYYQVIKGLKEGDVITTGANFLLDSEAKIRGTRD